MNRGPAARECQPCGLLTTQSGNIYLEASELVAIRAASRHRHVWHHTFSEKLELLLGLLAVR